ncbi:MAG: hypothetical protein OEY44_04800 [Candidatus Peregrinibacteria bacterium]|nr:hypothetical protein [Candidatus Peregrinibacteria bacterium]
MTPLDKYREGDGGFGDDERTEPQMPEVIRERIGETLDDVMSGKKRTSTIPPVHKLHSDIHELRPIAKAGEPQEGIYAIVAKGTDRVYGHTRDEDFFDRVEGA